MSGVQLLVLLAVAGLVAGAVVAVAVAVFLQRITMTDLNVLDLVAQVCLRCRSEEAAAEDGGGPARNADGEAAGPRRGDWHPLHCRAC